MTEVPSTLLRHPEFWRYYVLGDDYDLPEDFLRRFARPGAEEGTWEPVSFGFPLGDGGRLTLAVDLDLWSKSLGLELAGDPREYELGWWDETRWHPFALRWDELGRMHEHWGHRSTPLEVEPREAFLLLACFVGNAGDEVAELVERRNLVTQEYRALGLFDPSEPDSLAERTLATTDSDYRWTRTDGVGWTFSGEYSCYSLRNADHAGGHEGTFPIGRFEALIERL